MDADEFLKALKDGKILTNSQGVELYKSEAGYIWLSGRGFTACAMAEGKLHKGELSTTAVFKEFVVTVDDFEVKQ